MAKVLYQGHGSFRLTTSGGTVVYLDPFAGSGYDKPADLILVTHEHGDHNAVELVPTTPATVTLRSADMLVGGQYQTKTVGDVTVTAVPAYNKNHPVGRCVGYVVDADGKKLYFAGDTSTTEAMGEMAAWKLDYAFLPTDGIYNMNVKEASACAATIGAAHTVPVHTCPGALFDESVAERLNHPSRTIFRPGEEKTL